MKSKLNQKFKLTMITVYYIILLFLSIFNSIKISYVYIFPLVFEIINILFLVIKHMKNYNIKILEMLKFLVVLSTLIIGTLNYYININEIFIKLMLTITIIFEILVFVKNNLFNRKNII